MDIDDKVRELATWYRKQMQQGTRNDGAKFWSFKEHSGDDGARCSSLSQAAHDNCAMLPDDWRYQFLWESLGSIEDADDLDEIEVEADIYTAELTDWLGSRNDRSGYCDDAQRDGLVSEDSSMFDRMSIGQYLEKREVLDAVLAHLREEAEEQEAEAEEARA
jgi:hypothetical protein